MILDYEMMLILDGHGELRGEDGVWPVSPGTLVVIPPFVPHVIASFSGDAGSHCAMHFDLAAGIPDDGRDPGLRKPYRVDIAGVEPLPRMHPADADINRWFTTALTAFATATAQGRWEAGLACARILQRLWAAPPPIIDEAVAAACAAARASLHTDFDVADLAAIAGLSASRLRARFLHATGLAPRDWLARLRVERARTLLATSDASLATIAEQCGFADAYHLSHAYSRLTGESPSAFRAAVAAGRIWQAG
jgi:AraC-like DNA-binding protein